MIPGYEAQTPPHPRGGRGEKPQPLLSPRKATPAEGARGPEATRAAQGEPNRDCPKTDPADPTWGAPDDPDPGGERRDREKASNKIEAPMVRRVG